MARAASAPNASWLLHRCWKPLPRRSSNSPRRCRWAIPCKRVSSWARWPGPISVATCIGRRGVRRRAGKPGARVLTGGEIPDGPGNFYPPTVLIDLPREAPIAREEFFGPVAVIYAFRTEGAAVEVADGTH